MKELKSVTTERLVLEPSCLEHFDGLYAMNSDHQVMRFIGAVQSREEVEQSIHRQQEYWQKYGFGWWSIFQKGKPELIGAACVQHLGRIESNPLEIGWRLIPSAQGQGFATEAGRAAVHFAFEVVGVDFVTAVADPENHASTRVMERLGMRYRGIETHYNVPCATYALDKASVMV